MVYYFLFHVHAKWKLYFKIEKFEFSLPKAKYSLFLNASLTVSKCRTADIGDRQDNMPRTSSKEAANTGPGIFSHTVLPDALVI